MACSVRLPLSALDRGQLPGLDLAGLQVLGRYRGIDGLSAGDHRELFRAELEALLAAGGACAVVPGKTGPEAVAAVGPLPWDSAHFGLPMGKLVLAATASAGSNVLQPMLDRLLELARVEQGLRHLSAEVDIDDYACLNALLARGFEILDLRRSYRWRSMAGVPVPPLRTLVREYRPGDRATVLALADAATFPGRFSRDPVLAPERVTALYRQWLLQLLDAPDRKSVV